MELPKVSILVAARNEEDTIARCLEALTNIRYPQDKWEVLVGNDQSEDATERIAREYALQYKNIHVYTIRHTLGMARGKANVLAQLAQKAQGEYFLITDADTCPPPTWVRGMLQAVQPDVGIVTGFTVIEGKSFFANMQALDWLFALSFIAQVARLGTPVTAMGNNMLISRKAYASVGGYENIPFSITEDYALFKKVLDKGWKFRQLDQAEITATTRPIPTFAGLMHQRKRWMYGALQLQFFMKLIIYFQTFFLPLLVLLSFWSWKWALLAWFARITGQSIYILYQLIRLKRTKLLPFYPFYEGYLLIISFSMLIFYLLPIKVNWKGREYSVKKESTTT
ncbi:glycosyltransferase [Rapidithrix thailandica]|uniref:Glycosyltransferase n=1 Tax=Rapidithrix thailandica TaxID=413964 RepID=A0AAW9RZL0_9BACT